MHFQEYEAEDFLQEESFINYCLSTNEEDINFWKKWIASNPEKIDAVQEARDVYLMLNGNITARQFREDERAFREIADRHTGRNKIVSLRRRWLVTGLAAASILLFILFSDRIFSLFNNSSDFPESQFTQVSKPGERKSFFLPDGSKVVLNSGSIIRIGNDFTGSTREVSLEGEAFFDVAHIDQQPFIIHTVAMDVKVLGTVFNVKAYPSDKKTETSLIQGSVEVTLRNESNKKVVLKPSQKIIVAIDNNSQGVDNKSVDAINRGAYTISGLTYNNSDSSLLELSWTRNRLVFNNESFGEIATALKRWYDVELVFENDEIMQYKFSATFEEKDISQVMQALQLSRHFTFRQENNKIYIHE